MCAVIVWVVHYLLILPQVESLKMIVCNSANLSDCRNSFLNAVGTAVRLTNEQTSSHENVAERLVDLKVRMVNLSGCVLPLTTPSTTPRWLRVCWGLVCWTRPYK